MENINQQNEKNTMKNNIRPRPELEAENTDERRTIDENG